MTRALSGARRAPEVCGCGEGDDCYYFVGLGQPWCRPCEEHHRPPECPVDEQGRSLAPCGHPWEETDDPAHWDLHPED